MNKEQDIDNQLYKYLSPDLYCYVHNYIVDLKNANNQLTNNWNELEEWLQSEIERFKEIAVNQGLFIDKELNIRLNARIKLIENILDKMKEIKERKNENI